MSAAVVASCKCGCSYDEVGWAGLELCGNFCVGADETGPADHLELRNCSCGSTIAALLPEDHGGRCEARDAR
jgi:hypothetical protein